MMKSVRILPVLAMILFTNPGIPVNLLALVRLQITGKQTIKIFSAKVNYSVIPSTTHPCHRKSLRQ